ncbi:MAG: coproporphyrinogen III oxidase family protein [Treponema sp.]|nr:coproporphyrinogen III oxidase family protein [Treponema sp.]
METSLYIHVPFCAGTCDYCDFYSVLVTPQGAQSEDPRLQRYIEKLLSQAGRLFDTYKPSLLPTLYIGGGTPSVLGPAGILRLLRGLSQITSRHCPPPTEVTIEANPESADEAFLAAAREGGATRLSLGVQSFHGPSRRAAGRTGAGGPLLRRRLALAGEYFPAAFSGDIMSGLPFQTERVLLDDIGTLLGYSPAHVSLYALTLEPQTPLALAARPSLPHPDEADRLWLRGRDALETSGYSQYEVSNFCLPGQESRHNIRYWRIQNWLALGPGSSATIIGDTAAARVQGARYTVPPDVDRWLTGEPPDTLFDVEELDTPTLVKETFLMGFRYIEGPDEALFHRRFGLSIGDVIPKTLAAWRDRGLLRKDRAALTKDGLLFLGPFLIDVFRELDDSPLYRR